MYGIIAGHTHFPSFVAVSPRSSAAAAATVASAGVVPALLRLPVGRESTVSRKSLRETAVLLSLVEHRRVRVAEGDRRKPS